MNFTKEEIHYIQNWILSKHLLDFNEDAPSIQGKSFIFMMIFLTEIVF